MYSGRKEVCGGREGSAEEEPHLHHIEGQGYSVQPDSLARVSAQIMKA